MESVLGQGSSQGILAFLSTFGVVEVLLSGIDIVSLALIA